MIPTFLISDWNSAVGIICSKAGKYEHRNHTFRKVFPNCGTILHPLYFLKLVHSASLPAMSHVCFHHQVQGIRNELFSNEICSVVALEEIKGHFPAGTTFEDYWPAKGSIEALPNTRASAGAGNWTQKPAGQPNKIQVRLKLVTARLRIFKGKGSFLNCGHFLQQNTFLLVNFPPCL